MLQHIDVYSDSFTMNATVDSLKEVFLQMDNIIKGTDESVNILGMHFNLVVRKVY